MIKVNSLTKKYDNQIIINNITYEFEDNKFYCITGASGSGKSTLLYLLSGIEKADDGTICFIDKNYNNLKESEIAYLRLNNYGFIYQSYNLIPNLKVIDNILAPSYMIGKKKKNMFEKAMQMSEKVKIETLLNRYPYQLSGGEQQRVGIVRALINNPKLVFADEPTGNLDSKASDEVINLIIELQKELGFTLILVTHNLSFANKADVNLSMVDGNLKLK